MELLAATGVALWGYYVSTTKGRGPRARPTYADLNDDETADDRMPTDMVKRYRREAASRWEESKVPKATGIITPDTRPAETMPFFTSGKTQNSNTQYKQRKMELFSGNLLDGTSEMGTWKHKEEVQTMWNPKPQGVVTSGGTVGNAAGEHELEKARAVQSSLQNNVLPAEQLRVGPGLGVGPEIAATGGFHQFYRQLPLNVNDYKLTTLPGGVNHGASHVQKPEASQNTAVNHHPDALVWTLQDRPLERTTGALRAPMVQSDEARGFSGRRPLDTGYMGPGNSTIKAIRTTQYDDGTRGRTRIGTDDNSNPAINRTGARAGLGGYLFDDDDSLKPTSQRGQPGRESGTAGPSARISGTQMPTPDAMKKTTRESQNRALTNPGGRMNVFEPEQQGKTGVRARHNYDVMDHTQMKAPIQITVGSDGTPVRMGSKAIVRNKWLDLDIGKTQLKKNPYAKDVTCSKGAGQPLPQQQFVSKPWASSGSQPQQYPPWAKPNKK